MIACRVNGTAGQLWVNGASVDTDTMVVPQTSTDYDTRVGSGQNTQYLSGNILTVGAYSRALPNNEMERMHSLIRKQMRRVHQVGLE